MMTNMRMATKHRAPKMSTAAIGNLDTDEEKAISRKLQFVDDPFYSEAVLPFEGT